MPIATYTNRRTSQPATEPVTLAEIKRQVAIPLTMTEHDGLLTQLGKTAREVVENSTSRQLVNAEWVRGLDCFPLDGLIELPTNPVDTVDKIDYVDRDGVSQTLDTARYRLNNNREPAIVELIGAMPATDPRTDAVLVAYTAGYGSGTNETLKQAILMLVDAWFSDRSGMGEFPDHVKIFLVNGGFGDEFAQY